MNDKEEWSLKGKDVDMVRVTDNKEDTFGYPAYPLDILYSAKDIETLYQKLTDDILKIDATPPFNTNPITFHILNIIIKIINKRFGVKE